MLPLCMRKVDGRTFNAEPACSLRGPVHVARSAAVLSSVFQVDLSDEQSTLVTSQGCLYVLGLLQGRPVVTPHDLSQIEALLMSGGLLDNNGFNITTPNTIYTVFKKKTWHYIFDDNLNRNCPIAIIFGDLLLR